VRERTVIAVDWSGARGDVPHRGIWITAQRGEVVIEDRGTWSRSDAVEFVASTRGPVVAGFDFSFGVPAWFARERGCDTIDELWQSAACDGEEWLRPTPPFWRTACGLPPDRRFRRCEARLRAHGFAPKSVFQLVGNGQVGAGSVRGMPHLARLRAAGFAIWPFDAASDRMVLEIYPSLLRARFPDFAGGDHPSRDAADARVSARVMATRAEELSRLSPASDHVTRLEGDVWDPLTCS
jgi:hypothetical protein